MYIYIYIWEDGYVCEIDHQRQNSGFVLYSVDENTQKCHRNVKYDLKRDKLVIVQEAEISGRCKLSNQHHLVESRHRVRCACFFLILCFVLQGLNGSSMSPMRS